MPTSTPVLPPSRDALTPSEVVLIQGGSFAEAKRPVRIRMVLFFVVFTILGALGTYKGMGIILDAWASRSWPVAPGTIVSSQIRIEAGEFDSDPDLLYWADVRYKYEVAGQSYEGKRVRFGEGRSSKQALAQDVVGRYPVGIAVQVAYDPVNSKRSVLEPGVWPLSFLPFFIGLPMVLIGSAGLIFQLPLLFQGKGRRNV